MARVAWVVVPLSGGAAIESAVDGRSSAVRWTTAVGGWSLFAIVAIALLIPAVISLTLARVAAPLVIVAAVVVDPCPLAVRCSATFLILELPVVDLAAGLHFMMNMCLACFSSDSLADVFGL